MRKFILAIVIAITGMLASCGNKSYEQLTPEQQQKEYAQFQKDSLEQCTKNEIVAKAAVEGAFDRVPENNGYWKKDKVTVNYNDSLQCWEGIVSYHYDRNNTYFESTKKFYVTCWYENNGLAKDGKLFYTVSENPPVIEECICDTICVDSCAVCDTIQ